MRFIDILATRDSEWKKISLNITKSKESSEELLQEFYLEQAINGNEKDIKNLPAYVKRCLTNLYYDRHTKRKNKSMEFKILYGLDLPTDVKIFDEMIEDDRRIELETLFEDMNKFIKEDNDMLYKFNILKLNVVHGMSQKKIGESIDGFSSRKAQLAIESAREILKNKYNDIYNQIYENTNI